MKHQKTTFNSLLIRYNKYRKKLIRLHKAGKNEHRQLVLKKHLERIYTKLSSLPVSLSKQAVLAASFTAAMTFTAEKANSQVEFKENTINQFSLEPFPGPYIYASLAKADFDNDGDLDLMTNQYDGKFRYFENVGTPSSPEYTSFVENPFSLSDIGGYGILTVGDIDNDGDIDILVNQYGGGASFKYLENTGSSVAPNFASAIDSPFGLSASVYAASMQWIDIDDDNDFDLYVLNGGGHVFYENTGSNSAPAYATGVTNPFSLSFAIPYGRFIDFDNDGDFDLIGSTNSSFAYYENIGTAQSASFSAGVFQPFSLISTFSHISGLEALDIDGDNDFDLIYNDADSGDFHYFQNIGTSSSPKFTDGHTNLYGLQDLGASPDPTFGDLDNDGDLDMLTEVNGVLYYFENTGNAANPNFAAAVQNPFSLPGYGNNGTNCALVDIDGDNDLDLFMAYSNNFQFIENVGTAAAPSFGYVQSASFGIQNGIGFQFPEFVDLDNDGDFDILSQSGIYGDIYYYENTGNSSAPLFGTPVVNPFGFVTQGDRNNITVGDIDGDGDFDVIAGKSEFLSKDEFFFYENTGTASSPMFALSLSDPFNLRPVGSNNANPISTNPCIVDLNNNGVMDLMVGVQSGYYTFFENITPPSTAGITTNVNIMETIAIYPNPASDFITIKTDEEIEKVQLFDISGDLIQSETTNNFSIENLSSGIYIIDIKLPSGMYRTRLVKN